ncbi:MAG: hypothetical protein QG617_395 [Campylobacterota bacterium]|nr:hypothetical protein [Campylobacterota bacterium]
MKKIVLSTIAALAVSTTSLSAEQQFYVDEKGQVFTTSAADRIAIENKESSVFSKAKSLEFSGTHYLVIQMHVRAQLRMLLMETNQSMMETQADLNFAVTTFR